MGTEGDVVSARVAVLSTVFPVESYRTGSAGGGDDITDIAGREPYSTGFAGVTDSEAVGCTLRALDVGSEVVESAA